MTSLIPLGATVRWRDAIHKSAWSGVVTGHPRDKMVEVDGRGAISEGLLEVVKMVEIRLPQGALQHEALVAEVEALQAVVLQQCEVIAAMSADASEFKRLQGIETFSYALQDAAVNALLALTGTRRPSQRDCPMPELWVLAEVVEEFGD